MAYQDDGLTINATGYIVTGNTNTTGLITKSYLIDAYPQLLDQSKSAGLWVWGYNQFYGGLGDNTSTNKSSPIQTVAAGTNWKQVSAGLYYTAAIKTDGTLWLWGINGSGQLGDNTSTNKSSPIQTVAAGTNWKQVSVSYINTAAIKTDGTLWLWGANGTGTLGDNTITTASSPIQTVSGGTNWKQVSVGSAIAAIKTDGTLWTWGSNAYGGLGDNTITDQSSPIQTVAGGTNWKQVSACITTTTAIKTDGTLWTWGRNNYGQLGNNTIVDKSSPIQTVAGGTNWKQVSCGSTFICAIKTDGTLWTWGRNNAGQLGDNTLVDKSSPIQTVAGGTNWKQVSGFENCTQAIKTDGTLWLWGTGTSGQMGDNTTTNKSSPVQTVAGGTNWKQVSGSQNIAAIKEFTEDL